MDRGTFGALEEVVVTTALNTQTGTGATSSLCALQQRALALSAAMILVDET